MTGLKINEKVVSVQGKTKPLKKLQLLLKITLKNYLLHASKVERNEEWLKTL